MLKCYTNYKAYILVIVFTVLCSLLPSLQLKADSSTLISKNKPTSSYTSERNHDSDMAVDSVSDNSNYWGASLGDTDNTWWQVDLQANYQVSQINIRNWADGKRYYHYYIRGSMDGIHWTPLAVKANDKAAIHTGDTYHITAATARYIRVNMTFNSANHSVHISDFKVYGTPYKAPSASKLNVSSVSTAQGAYAKGDSIKISYRLQNPSSHEAVKIKSIRAKISGLTNPLFLQETTLASAISLSPKQTLTIKDKLLWAIPTGTPIGAYGIYLQYHLSDGTMEEAYQTFFRITNSRQLTTFNISEQSYKGMNIFKLDGGMSAEYAVAKAGEALSAGIANSWDIPGPGRGPTPIFSTPQFLENSVQKTVDYYNNSFGSTTNYDTVIISTGVASASYLSRSMKAPILPLHFLVSVDTTKELQSILSYSNNHGLTSYSTLGYDGSMPTGVAWVKMLTLPQAYKDFLNQHHVKNVVILGSNGTIGGETTSKKIMDTGVSYSTGSNPGDIFVIYTNNGTAGDISKLKLRIKDLHEIPLEANYRHVSDWESGVVQEQVDQFSKAIKAGTEVKAIDFVTGKTYIHVFNLATFASLEFLKKNEAYLSKKGDVVKGIVLNPYLVSLPFYESKIQYVPLLFWQYDSMTSTVNTRVNKTVRNAVKAYFPNLDFNKLQFRIRSSNNFPTSAINTMKTQLNNNGLVNVSIPTYSKDEVWNPADGMNAPYEAAASDLLAQETAADLKAWDAQLQPITLKDLESIPTKYPEIKVTRQ